MLQLSGKGSVFLLKGLSKFSCCFAQPVQHPLDMKGTSESPVYFHYSDHAWGGHNNNENFSIAKFFFVFSASLSSEASGRDNKKAVPDGSIPRLS